METLNLSDIVLDDRLRCRVSLNQKHVDEIAATLADGGTIQTPVTVVEVEGRKYLADGYHRAAAAKKKRHSTIPANVSVGTRLDVAKIAAGANRTSGLKYNNADKRNAVKVLLDAAAQEQQEMSNRLIAQLVGVTHHLVNDMRTENNVSTQSAPTQVEPSSTRRGIPVLRTIQTRGKQGYDYTPEVRAYISRKLAAGWTPVKISESLGATTEKQKTLIRNHIQRTYNRETGEDTSARARSRARPRVQEPSSGPLPVAHFPGGLRVIPPEDRDPEQVAAGQHVFTETREQVARSRVLERMSKLISALEELQAVPPDTITEEMVLDWGSRGVNRDERAAKYRATLALWLERFEGYETALRARRGANGRPAAIHAD